MDKCLPMLASMSTGTGASNEHKGHIAVWDIFNQHIPLCVLKGHTNELCADFAWLVGESTTIPSLTPPQQQQSQTTTPLNSVVGMPLSPAKPVSRTSSSPTAYNNKGSSSHSGNASAGGAGNVGGGNVGGGNVGGGNVGGGNVGGGNVGDTTRDNNCPAPHNVFLGVVSASRNGKLFVQDMMSGFFPSQHLCPTVTAISAQGHIAFHRGTVR